VTEVIRAVLLAAGRGTRLGALTANTAKPMLEVGGKPILHRIVAGLAAGGIQEVMVVTGHSAESLEAATGDGSRWGVVIRYVRQHVPDGTARAVALARDFVGDEPFFAGWGDVVVEPGNYGPIINATAGADGAIAVNEVDDPATGAAVYVDSAMRVTRIIEKPEPGTSTTRWNNAGMMVLPAAIWPHIESLPLSPRSEYELPQAVAALVAAGCELRAVPVLGPWFDIGTAENLAAARAHFGSSNR
jgi:dTDP-glucose pyrophosphorylase